MLYRGIRFRAMKWIVDFTSICAALRTNKFPSHQQHLVRCLMVPPGLSVARFSESGRTARGESRDGLCALYHGVPGRMRSFRGRFERINEITRFIALSKLMKKSESEILKSD